MSNNSIEVLRQKVREIEADHAPQSNCGTTSNDDFSGTVDFESANSSNDINKRVRWSAMELLARREHSVRELTNKLLKRFPDNPVQISECVAALTQDNLQSDSRFCEAYVAMRKRKGYGPQRIAAELRERGVNESLSKAQLRDPEHDWFTAAEEVWARKFHGNSPQDLKEKARQMRFLSYRGFYSSHIQAILD